MQPTLRGLAKELAAGRGAHGGGAHRLRDPAEDARGDLRDARRARAPALRAPGVAEPSLSGAVPSRFG